MVASMFMVILITVGMILSFKLRSWGTLDFSSKSVILGELLILRVEAVSSTGEEVFSVFFRIVYTPKSPAVPGTWWLFSQCLLKHLTHHSYII